jgi:hypothetical protein
MEIIHPIRVGGCGFSPGITGLQPDSLKTGK